jgi:hypothetical protein
MTEKTYIDYIAEKMSKENRYKSFFKEDVGTMPALAKDEDNAAKQNAEKKNTPGEKTLKDAGLEVPAETKGASGQATTRGADKVQQDPDNKKFYDAMGVKLGEETEIEEANDVDADNAEKALKHDCASHVVHKEHGEGRCIPGMHTLEENEDGTGYVTHYDVMFQGEEGPFIVENCPVEDLEIVQEMNHGHSRKKKKGVKLGEETEIEEATITVDHDKARHDPKTRHADPYVHGGYRGVSSDKWNAAHKYLMKKKGVSDHHASLIKKHEDAAKSNKTKSSNKKGYEGMSHHDGYTVHSSYDDQGHGGGGVAKYHIHKSN